MRDDEADLAPKGVSQEGAAGSEARKPSRPGVRPPAPPQLVWALFPKLAVFRLSHSQVAAPCFAHAEQLSVPIEAGCAHLHICKMYIDGNAHVEIHPKVCARPPTQADAFISPSLLTK